MAQFDCRCSIPRGARSRTQYVEGVSGTDFDHNLRLERRADSDGAFAFSGLQEGSYVLVARFHHDFTVAREGLSVQSGQSLEVELDAGSFGTIEARILAHPDDLKHAWVEARARGQHDAVEGPWSIFDGTPPPRAAVAADGRVLLAPLRPATYRLTLNHSPTPLSGPRERWSSGFGGGQPLGSVTVVGSDVAHAEFDIWTQRRGTIHLQARLEGEPAVGCSVWATSTTDEAPPRTRRASAVVGADGFARLGLLEPGAWQVGLKADDGAWSAWISAPAALSPGGELTLRLDVDRIRGRLRVLDAQSGQPRATTWIHWQHPHGSARLTTDSNGELELFLPPGAYSASRNGAPIPVEWTASGPVPAEIRL